MSLIVGQPLDKATRTHLRTLLRAVSGDTTERGAQLAAERILVLAPRGEVTLELVEFVDKLVALAVSRCPRCLDPSIGLCQPCRGPHAREHGAAARGVPFEHEPVSTYVQPVAGEWAKVWTAPEPERDPIDRAMAHCTRKTRYGTMKIANQVARRCEEERGGKLRAYACLEGCGGFHIAKDRDPS